MYQCNISWTSTLWETFHVNISDTGLLFCKIDITVVRVQNFAMHDKMMLSKFIIIWILKYIYSIMDINNSTGVSIIQLWIYVSELCSSVSKDGYLKFTTIMDIRNWIMGECR